MNLDLREFYTGEVKNITMHWIWPVWVYNALFQSTEKEKGLLEIYNPGLVHLSRRGPRTAAGRFLPETKECQIGGGDQIQS